MRHVLVRWVQDTHIALGHSVRKRSVGDEDLVSFAKAQEMVAVGLAKIVGDGSIPVLGGPEEEDESSSLS